VKVPGEERLSDPGRTPVATSGGTWQGVTGMLYGYLVGVRCRPTQVTTIYNLRVVDRDSYEIYERKGLKGETVDHLLRAAVRGVCTVYIEQATSDEAFNLKLMVEGI
jgi:hypothetical protein